MTAVDLLASLKSRGVRLEPRPNGNIHVAPKNCLTPELIEQIRANKATLLALLTRDEAEVATPAPVARESERADEISADPDVSAFPALPLRRCGSLVCRTCHVHNPSPHREDCTFPRFEPCRSRWFWLSPHGAIKCIACAAPTDLALVEAWVLAREDSGYRIPPEILSLLHITTPIQ